VAKPGTLLNMLFKPHSPAPPSEAVHGALDYRELAALGLRAEDVLDFSANTNPFGLSPGAGEALRGIALDRYPDREARAVREAFAARMGVPVEHVTAGNGASELIGLVAQAFLQPDDDVLFLGPTYGEYARAAGLRGARLHTCQSTPASHFQWNAAEVEHALAEVTPRLVFVCNPNNPTGRLLPRAVLDSWRREHPQTLFVVDEAYLEFTSAPSAVALSTGTHAAENLLVLRSMTKAYGLAGLRLGFALGAPALMQAIEAVRPPWNVNALAQAAGVAALADHEHLRASLTQLEAAKQQLLVDLREIGLAPLESATSFFLVQVDDGRRVRGALLARGLVVRDCASFGLPQYIRISTQRPEHNARLVAALREIVPC
jgi:L-threonine-O-3-phosphate decarboxylase